VSRRLTIAALLLVGLPIPAGAAVPADVQDSPEQQSLDEVLVQGTQLWKLRQQMIRVEDEFYALYNELNKDKDFDVHCHTEAPPDRIIKERVCRVAYYEDAQALEAQALLDGHSAPPADMVAEARNADFERHFLQVVNSDPRLLKLVREREALGKKYDRERAQRSTGHR